MFGAYTFGAPYFGQSPSPEIAVILLRHQDASLLILRPRTTNYAVPARFTLLRIPTRITIDRGFPPMTMRVPLEPKTPAEEKDYGIDWRKYVASGVTIATSLWTFPSGITKVGDGTIDGLYTLIRVADGTEGETYELKNQIVTSAGETLQRSIEVRVMTPDDVLEL